MSAVLPSRVRSRASAPFSNSSSTLPSLPVRAAIEFDQYAVSDVGSRLEARVAMEEIHRHSLTRLTHTRESHWAAPTSTGRLFARLVALAEDC